MHQGNELAFRGGTAIHKLHLQPAGRYSEDLDLVQVRGEPIGAVLSAVRNALDPWLGSARYKAGEGRATLLYRFIAEGADAVPMRLKIEINTREHFAVLPRRRVPFAIDSAWCRGSAEIPTYATEELLGTKLRALYQRRKGRDVFDLGTALERLPDLDRVIVLGRCHLLRLLKRGPRLLQREPDASQPRQGRAGRQGSAGAGARRRGGVPAGQRAASSLRASGGLSC